VHAYAHATPDRAPTAKPAVKSFQLQGGVGRCGNQESACGGRSGRPAGRHAQPTPCAQGRPAVAMLSPLCRLERVALHAAATEGLDAQRGGRLELGRAIDGQAQRQDQHEAGSGHAPGDLSGTLDRAQRAQLRRKGMQAVGAMLAGCDG
jgi:hypothetical protein